MRQESRPVNYVKITLHIRERLSVQVNRHEMTL
jgi:hypothetical protein